MNRSTWFFHPIAVFVFSVVALATSLFLYIYWYMEVSTRIEAVVRNFNLDRDQVLKSQTWVVILVLSILVGIILLGIFTIFVYHQKTLQLYQTQQNFINNFTHELKTPVTSLKLYLETFLKHELSRDDQIKYLSYMIQDVGRLSDHINRILDLAKIESKSYGGEFATLDIVDILGHFFKTNRHLFGNCEINVHNPSGLTFPCRIHRPLFEMLLMNLMTNAIKYNQSEIPKVDITLLSRKRKVHLRFEDNGIGLDKGETTKVFKKFYQVGRSESLSARGSGIGLSLVQNIARMHKGKVVAESGGIGKGSVFTFVLPCASANPT